MVLADLHRGSGGMFLPKADDELQIGVDSLARIRSWNSLLWMFMAVPVGITFSAVPIYCWILMLHKHFQLSQFWAGSPEPCSMARAEMCSKCRHPWPGDWRNSTFLQLQGAAHASSSSFFIRSGRGSSLRNKKPNSSWLTRK